MSDCFYSMLYETTPIYIFNLLCASVIPSNTLCLHSVIRMYREYTLISLIYISVWYVSFDNISVSVVPDC
jgi:hypothetical protein